MRSIFLALLATLFVASPSLADDKPSPSVKKILDEAANEVKKNRQDFDAANQKPLATAREKLQELAKKLVDEGKAEEAGLVLKQVGTLEADVMKNANAPASVPSGGKPSTRTPQRAKIPADAVSFRGHRYYIFVTPMTKHVAQAQCESLGGHLARIDTAEENAYLAARIAPLRQHVWIDGGDEETEGQWMFSDGRKMAYFAWDGTADNSGGVEHAIELKTNGMWNDAVSTYRLPFICEWDD